MFLDFQSLLNLPQNEISGCLASWLVVAVVAVVGRVVKADMIQRPERFAGGATFV
jgi:hypothetical protein